MSTGELNPSPVLYHTSGALSTQTMKTACIILDFLSLALSAAVIVLTLQRTR